MTLEEMRRTYGETSLGRIPVTFRQCIISDDLLRYLQHATIFQATRESDLRKPYERCVDHPGVPGHTYYEGYFHALWNSNGSFLSINPRLGIEMDKPRAPLELLAFCEGIRRCNTELINDILSSLKDNTSRQAQMLRSLLERGQHFADLAVQIHFGDEVPPAHIGYHVDAPNSLLHMAVSIGGSRVLHWFESGDHIIENKDAQTEGDVYLSSPSAFRHGVQYPACDWHNKTIAIMCRFLLTEHDLIQLYDSKSTDWPALYEVVSTAIAKHEFVMPTLHQVENIASEKREAGCAVS